MPASYSPLWLRHSGGVLNLGKLKLFTWIIGFWGLPTLKLARIWLVSKYPTLSTRRKNQSKIRFWNVEIWWGFHHSRQNSYRYGSWEPPPTTLANENYYPSPHSSLGWVYAASAPKRSLAVDFDEQNGCRSPQQRRKTSVSCFSFIPEKKHGCFRLQCRFLLSGWDVIVLRRCRSIYTMTKTAKAFIHQSLAFDLWSKSNTPHLCTAIVFLQYQENHRHWPPYATPLLFFVAICHVGFSRFTSRLSLFSFPTSNGWVSPGGLLLSWQQTHLAGILKELSFILVDPQVARSSGCRDTIALDTTTFWDSLTLPRHSMPSTP